MDSHYIGSCGEVMVQRDKGASRPGVLHECEFEGPPWYWSPEMGPFISSAAADSALKTCRLHQPQVNKLVDKVDIPIHPLSAGDREDFWASSVGINERGVPGS